MSTFLLMLALLNRPIEVTDDCSVDLQHGRASCLVTLDGNANDPPLHSRGQDFQFWLERVGKRRYLTPMNGVRLAAAVDGGCRSIQYPKGQMRVDNLLPGTRVCARTKRGGYFEFEIDPGRNVTITHVLLEP